MQAVNTFALKNNNASLRIGNGKHTNLWKIYAPFHIGYVLCYIIAYIPGIGAFCTQ